MVGCDVLQAQGAKVLETCLYLLSVLSVECYIVIGVILYGYIVIGGSNKIDWYIGDLAVI